MPVISVKHENNKPGYACFHIGERRDKRWSCRSSSVGRTRFSFRSTKTPRRLPETAIGGNSGPGAAIKRYDRLRFYCSHAQRSVAVPTTATIMSVVAAVPADRSTARLNETRSGSRAELRRKWWPQFLVSCSNCLLPQRSFVPVA